MRLLVPCTFMLLLFAAMAKAQGRIETGEHGDYTRVVFPIGVERGFAIEGEGTARRIVFDPPVEFSTESVLRPLSAGRVQAIDSSTGAIEMQLGCRCNVQAYRYLDRFLILDVYDDPTAVGPVISPLPRPWTETPQIETDAGTLVQLPTDAPTIERARLEREYRPTEPLARALLRVRFAPIPRTYSAPEEISDGQNLGSVTTSNSVEDLIVEPLAEPVQQEATAQDFIEPGDLVTTEDVLAGDETEPSDRSIAASDVDFDVPNISATAEALAQQLARAASAGLLEDSGQDPVLDHPTGESAIEAEPDTPPDVAEGDPEPSGLPVRAANAFDIAGDRDGGLTAVAAALSCAQPIGDMSSWSTGIGFDQELGQLRQAAFDPNGELLPGPTIELARYYIFHGFGAEAEAWLLQLDAPPTVELAMARYLDNRPGPNFVQIETLALCSGLDILWRFVDASDFPELALSQRQEMRLAFSGLPIGLRRLLGPDFVRRLAAEGYADDAADVREALSRGATLGDDEVLVLEMETTDQQPSRRDTEALEQQLQNAGPDVARVMREFLAARRLANDPPEESQLIAADALLRETNPGYHENGLWQEVLLAHAKLENMAQVFSMLDELDDASPQESEMVYSSVIEVLLQSQENAPIVVMSARLADMPNGLVLPYPVQTALQERLQNIGLSDLADAFRLEEDAPQALPTVTAQNWAAAATGTDGAAADVAQRVAELEQSDVGLAIDQPDDIRAAVEDSRLLRAQLNELLAREAN